MLNLPACKTHSWNRCWSSFSYEVFGACLFLLLLRPLALRAQDCNANTTDPAYNHACADCESQAFAAIWACNAWMPSGGPADPIYQTLHPAGQR